MAIAALVSLPVGVPAAGRALLNPVTDGLVAALAAVATVVPYTLDNLALGKLPKSTFGVLMSLDPALAAAAGLIILGQHLSPGQLLAIFLVMSASAGVVLTAPAKTVDPSTSSASA
jgi:inner membrane transporter RhtA